MRAQEKWNKTCVLSNALTSYWGPVFVEKKLVSSIGVHEQFVRKKKPETARKKRSKRYIRRVVYSYFLFFLLYLLINMFEWFCPSNKKFFRCAENYENNKKPFKYFQTDMKIFELQVEDLFYILKSKMCSILEFQITARVILHIVNKYFHFYVILHDPSCFTPFRRDFRD